MVISTQLHLAPKVVVLTSHPTNEGSQIDRSLIRMRTLREDSRPQSVWRGAVPSNVHENVAVMDSRVTRCLSCNDDRAAIESNAQGAYFAWPNLAVHRW